MRFLVLAVSLFPCAAEVDSPLLAAFNFAKNMFSSRPEEKAPPPPAPRLSLSSSDLRGASEFDSSEDEGTLSSFPKGSRNTQVEDPDSGKIEDALSSEPPVGETHINPAAPFLAAPLIQGEEEEVHLVLRGGQETEETRMEAAPLPPLGFPVPRGRYLLPSPVFESLLGVKLRVEEASAQLQPSVDGRRGTADIEITFYDMEPLSLDGVEYEAVEEFGEVHLSVSDFSQPAFEGFPWFLLNHFSLLRTFYDPDSDSIFIEFEGRAGSRAQEAQVQLARPGGVDRQEEHKEEAQKEKDDGGNSGAGGLAMTGSVGVILAVLYLGIC